MVLAVLRPQSRCSSGDGCRLPLRRLGLWLGKKIHRAASNALFSAQMVLSACLNGRVCTGGAVIA